MMATICRDRAYSMNGGKLAKDLSLRTDPASGGYSALIPVEASLAADGAVAIEVCLDVRVGRVGVSAVDHSFNILAERTSTGLGRQNLIILAPNIQSITGILLRNMSADGRPSESEIGDISITVCPVGSFLSIPPPLSHGTLTLAGRRYSPADGVWSTQPKTLSLSSAVAIIIDPWTKDPGTGLGWNARRIDNIDQKLRPTLDALRKVGMRLIYAPHDEEIHPSVAPQPGDMVLPGSLNGSFLAQILRQGGIGTLIYMGYASNMCVLFRECGLLNMAKEKFDILYVRDASIAVEMKETLDEEWIHQSVVNLIETNLAATVSAEELTSSALASTYRTG